MWRKILGSVALIAIVVVGSGVGYLYLRKPAVAPPSVVRVAMTPERVARGKRLFDVLMDCSGCHSAHDESRFGRPVLEGAYGAGFVFPAEVGLPGSIVAPNITPDRETGLGAWTDGEKIRAIREGISRNGEALFPMMPYTNFRHLSDEDVQALVAYMNTLKPVRHSLPRSRVRFPVSLLIKSAPQPAGRVAAPDPRDRLKFGAYLAAAGGCADCHTALKHGQPDEASKLAGGREFHLPFATVISANITPDAETGIGRWSEQQFVDKFYQYKEYAEKGAPRIGPEGFTLMPWLGLSQLSREELGAVYTWLMAQPAVHNAVETHPGQPSKS